MPRSKQYEVNEAFISSQTTLNNSSVHERGNHVGAPPPPKKSSIPTGWCLGIAFAALCMAFILCVAFLNFPGVPTERANAEEARILRKRGYLRIYPDPVVSTSAFRTKFLTLSDVESPVQQLRDALSGYPEYTDSYTTCFVSVPTYSHPCYFEKEWLGNTCSEENSFGYEEVNGTINPCILLTLENLTDWQPKVYVRAAVDRSWIDNYDPNFGNLGCMMKEKRDEKKRQAVNIYPVKGFPNQFFPVSNFDGSLYLKPSVMIQVTDLPVGESVELQCWLRVSNAYMLEDDGEIVLNITAAGTFTSSASFSVQQSTSTSTEVFTETTTGQRLPPTSLPTTKGGFFLNQDN